MKRCATELMAPAQQEARRRKTTKISAGQRKFYAKQICRNGTVCTRGDCHFKHPDGRAIDLLGADAIHAIGRPICRFGADCTRRGCAFFHRDGREQKAAKVSTCLTGGYTHLREVAERCFQREWMPLPGMKSDAIVAVALVLSECLLGVKQVQSQNQCLGYVISKVSSSANENVCSYAKCSPDEPRSYLKSCEMFGWPDDTQHIMSWFQRDIALSHNMCELLKNSEEARALMSTTSHCLLVVEAAWPEAHFHTPDLNFCSGAVDDTDVNARGAAIRELGEEVGINASEAVLALSAQQVVGCSYINMYHLDVQDTGIAQLLQKDPAGTDGTRLRKRVTWACGPQCSTNPACVTSEKGSRS